MVVGGDGEKGLTLRNASAARTMPSAEAMTAPRPREQRRPPSQFDTLLPPRRGGGSSPYTYGGNRRRSAVSRACLWCAVSLAWLVLALPATAQQNVLVSNLDKRVTDAAILTDRYLRAQAFSVPSGGGDYTFTSIRMENGTGNDIPQPGDSGSNINKLSVTVWSADASGHPASSLYQLINPVTVGEGLITFTAPVGAKLEAGKTYVVVLHYNHAPTVGIGPNFSGTTDTAEDEDSITGWTIADMGLWRGPTDTSWSEHDFAFNLLVRGAAVIYKLETPILTARAVAPMQVTLEWDRILPALKTIDPDAGYGIEWSPDGSTSWTSLVNDLWCTCYPTKFNDDTIEPGETRHYRIRAVDDDDVSAWSTVVSATTPGLVDSDGGLILPGAVESELDALNDQKVFRIRLETGEYRFRISGAAPKHRVIVTDPGGTEIENFVLESSDGLSPRITAQRTGEHQVKVSHGGGFGNAGGGSPKAGRFHFTLLPVSEESAATLSLRRDPQITATLNTYGDRDTWGVSVDGGAAYAVRVRGREDGQGTAATPSIRRANPPGNYTDHRMDKPWVPGVTTAAASSLCAKFDEPEKCEYQAFVIDLRGVTGAEQRFEIDVGPTQRPDTRPYRVGTYVVDLRELSSSQLQGVRMPLRAWFASQPAQHDGSKRFKVQVGFSDTLGGRPEQGVDVEGGEVTCVRWRGGGAWGGAPDDPLGRRAGRRGRLGV